MATDIDLQQIENATKQLLEGRVDSVRQLAQARAHVATKLDEVRAAESADKAAYDAALKAGWTGDELRKVGLSPMVKRARTGARRSSTKKQPDMAPATAASSNDDQE